MNDKPTYEELEKNLKKSQEYLRILMENTSDYILISDKDGNPLVFNSAYAKIIKDTLGIDMKPGIKPHEFLPDKEAVAFWDKLHDRVLKGEKFKIEYPVEANDKETRWFEFSFNPIIQDGLIIGFTELSRDITEHKKTTNDLFETNRILKDIQQNAKIGNWWTHQIWDIVHWSEEMYRIFGLDPKSEPPDYEENRKIIHPDDWELFDNTIHTCLSTGKGYDLEFRILLPSGEVRYVNTKGYPEKDSNGDVKRLVGMTQDITERKLMEDSLKESESKYRTIFEGSTLGIIVMDFESRRFVAANESICRLFGYSNTELLDKSITDLHPKEVMDQVISDIKRQAQGKHTISNWIPCLRKDGTIFYADIAGAKIRVNGKECTVGFFNDITRRKEMENDLKKAHDELEKRVRERTEELRKANESLNEKTISLEEVNTALKVLLEKRDKDKEEDGEKILLNVKEFLIPYVNKLKNSNLTENQKSYLDLLESGLQEIISPFAQRLTSKYMHITPRELQVANHVKEGRTSKEIAEILNCTERTIVAHRVNLRNKLGLKKTSNLRTYLLSLQEQT